MIRPHTTPPTQVVWMWSIVASLMVLLGSCKPTPTTTDWTTLQVALSQEIAGCAVVGGERYGFATDVADTIANRLGKKFHASTHHTTKALQELLATGAIDIAVVPRNQRVEFHRYPSESFYTSNFVLLMPQWASIAAGVSTEEAWRGKRVLTDCNFRHTKSYRELIELGAICPDGHIEGIDMARSVNERKADAIVCERSEAELLKYLYRNLREVASIGEATCEVILIFRNAQLKELFVQSLREFAQTEEYAFMVELYFGATSIGERFTQLRYRPTRVVGGISVWDDMIRRICAQQGVDWRLMSAMAYHESRFRNDQVSHRGAVGLMQVTPIAAQDLVGEDGDYDLSDPNTNITLAARLLKRYSRALGFGPTPITDDQMAIVVASYNCGITRMIEAQRLTELTGGSKESWSDVSTALLNMNDKQWRETYGCRYDSFRDAPITIAYTNGVMESFNTYRRAIQ